MELAEKNKDVIPAEKPSRPILLSLLCVFSFVFSAIVSILFLVSVFYSGRLTSVINQYMPDDNQSGMKVFLICFGGFALHAVSFAGTFLIWRLKKTGYYLLSSSSLLIAGYQLFHPKISTSVTLIYIVSILLFGLFFRKLR